ncbi:MAG: PP2C family protein-serine/threonine phosphatase [Oscillospiraceae bacterium]|nr:PP2C family protein-serine/threonine phosphatase [Oscillospiraceae bacterium]
MSENKRTKRPRRVSMQVKLSALVICSILLVALGLSAISYYVFCQRVDTKYTVMAQRAAEACANNVDYDQIAFFWSMINTKEFQTVRDRARQSGDEGIIEDWLRTRKGFYEAIEEWDDPDFELAGPSNDETWSLLGDYVSIQNGLQAIKDYLDVDSAYYQYDDGTVTYNIADADENLFYIGTIEEPIEAFEDYPGNVSISPIVYHSDFGWLLTAMEPVMNWETMEPVAVAGVDFNMTEIMRERYSFLQQSLTFVTLLLAAAIAASVAVLRRTAIRPLRELAEAATRFAKEDRAFTKEDVIELDIRGNDEVTDLYQEIRSMENRIVDYTEHLTQATAEKERVSTELRTASQIQESMLPSIFPAFPDRNEFDLYASMTPAKEVGGDFYDFFLIDDTHLAVLIADVSDKGVPAALFMMSAKILINYRAQMGGSPSEILTAVNAEICKNNKSRMFVTVWLGILDLDTGVLTCANAGHEYPLVRGADGRFRIYKDRHGLVVGALAKSGYRDYEIKMAPGDAVFVYTDGVPEANNAEGAFYGMERLTAALNEIAGQAPRQILEGIKENVDAFTGEARQFDDLTMLCLEYRGKAAPLRQG